MSLIPDFFLDTVVALGVPDPNGSVEFTATGFLYGYPVGKNEKGVQQYWIFLVTNRHVIANKTEFMVRFNGPMDASPKTYTLPVGNSPGAIHWTLHPDPNVDVAVLLIDAIGELLKDVKLSFIYGNYVASLEKLRQGKFSEGNEVFVLGYPMGLAGEEQNYVIVRHGIVARIQDWYDSSSKSFLIDSSVFPGNSGGPVFAKPTLHTYGEAIIHAKLIGMVSSYLPYQEIAVSEQTGLRRMIFEENSGLATVVPIDAIQETISIAAKRYMDEQSMFTPETN
ncbi:MAG: serine protease [Candidatus Poribacteria bacterium]|nr:serine protease [Candidatus Poribacteria bacterium]